VLEREPVAGGRMRSERITTPRGDFVVDRGAQFVASGYRNLQRVVDALGLRARLHPVAKTSNAILRDGMLHAGDYGSLVALRVRLLSTRAKLRLPRLLLELASIAAASIRIAPSGPRIDRESLARELRASSAKGGGVSVRVAFSSTFDADPEDLSGAFALLSAASCSGFGSRRSTAAWGCSRKRSRSRCPCAPAASDRDRDPRRRCRITTGRGTAPAIARTTCLVRRGRAAGLAGFGRGRIAHARREVVLCARSLRARESAS
jgi:hypothetical protein